MMFFWMFGVPPPITTSGHESAMRCQRAVVDRVGACPRSAPALPWISSASSPDLDLELGAHAAC